MKDKTLDVSAVVLSFNSAVYIKKCIASLFDSFAQCGLNGEVHVVENGSSDGSVAILNQLLAEFAGRLHVIFQTENTGTTRSRNSALRQCSGKSVLVLDSDAYMNAHALAQLLAYQKKTPAAGLVAPKLTYPDGRFQLSVDTFPTLVRKLVRLYALRTLENAGTVQNTGPVDYAISACWLLRADAIDKVGLLDENIFYSPEDVDYCIRLWKAGYQVHYFPEASVVHDAQEISRPKSFFINKFTVRHAKGLVYLFAKHRYVFSLKRLYKKMNRLPV